MPTNSTLRPGAMTSRIPLSAAAESSPELGRAKDVAARLLVRIKLDEAPLLRFLQQVGERAEAIIGFVEARMPALERLLHHRAPDLLFRATLRGQGLERAEQQVEGFLLLVFLVLARRGRFPAFLGGAALLLLGAHQVVV